MPRCAHSVSGFVVIRTVPLLASFKIICERVEHLAPIAEFLTLYIAQTEEDA